MLAERLARVGDAGAQRMDRRLAEVTAELERRQEEMHADIERRRDALEQRLRELGREIPSANL